MKGFKSILNFSLVLFIIATSISCTSVPKLQKEAPTEIESVYYQKWNAGTKESGSGINVFIDIKDPLVTLDSVYFRGQATKLQQNPNNSSLYVGRFKVQVNDSIDNSKKPSHWVFQLEDNECVISYFEEQKVLYYKITNIVMRQSINYPSLPSKI